MGYRVSVLLAALSVLLAVVGLAVVLLWWDEYLGDPLKPEQVLGLALILVGPTLLPLTLWRWDAAVARLLVPLLSIAYGLWVAAWDTSLVGFALWPAALVLFTASVFRAFASVPSLHVRVLTDREVHGQS